MERRPGRAFTRARAFTMVELLTVIAIIVLLLGLLVPAMSGAKNSSRKTRELNDLRQVGMAWTLYANNHNEYLLPGFLEPGVQTRWQVRFDYPQGLPIPPDIAGPWTWRLAPFLDSAHQTLHGYADEHDFDPLDVAGTPEAQEIAREPAFGYNAYYLGGWWSLASLEGSAVPRYQFFDARADLDGDGTIGPAEYARVVVQSAAQIRRAEELVVFAASSWQEPMPAIQYERLKDRSATVRGFHWVSPSRFRDVQNWDLPRIQGQRQTEMVIEVLEASPVPLGRYTGNVATLFADGHADALLPGRLGDMRRFIDIADSIDFEHR